MNTSIRNQISELLEDPYRAARAAAEAGHRVIGYVGPDVPVELILAAGAVPVRLSGEAEAATPHADDFIERAFLPEVRSIAEQWVTGALDFIDGIVLPRSNDTAQRLYYYLCELRRRGACSGPTPFIYDIASIGRLSSTQHTIAATLKLAKELGARQSTLSHAVDEVTDQTRVLHRLWTQQQSEQPLRGSVAYRLARALHSCWDKQFRRDLQDHIDTLPSYPAAARVLLVGNAPPDDRLHRAVEMSGACIVRELTEANWFADRPAPEPQVRSFEAIGLRAHTRTSLAQRLAHSGETILKAARDARAAAVVIWMIEEDSTLGWALPDQLAELKRAGVPTLALTRQRWAAQSDTLQAIGNFCAGLGESP
jgi:2-hydroxyglutaryl-CoA dehydratase, D-component